MYDQDYFGIGFKNNAGGYEIRNPKWKGSSMPKDITTIDNGANKVVVLEGGFEYMTFLTIHGLQEGKKYNFCILNGAAMFERARPFLESHQEVFLYFNNDATGMRYRDYALSLNDRQNPKYFDHSDLYKPYNDLNAWHCEFGSGKQQRKGHGL